MHDFVIRGGTIVDGTGKAAFTGDVAIKGERIAEVGGKLGPARREIDAAGLLVTPGWVDCIRIMTGRRYGIRCSGLRAGTASPRRCSAIAASALPRCGRSIAPR
jgi:predicted amidohydrolase